MDFESQLNRRRLLQAGAGLSLAGPARGVRWRRRRGRRRHRGCARRRPRPRPRRPRRRRSRRRPPSPRPAPRVVRRRRVVRRGVDGRRGRRASRRAPRSSRRTRPTRKGSLEVFDWQGYEDTAGCPDSCYGFWDLYVNGPYGKSNPLKFTFLEDDQQALAKVAAGFKTDVAHPCIAYIAQLARGRADPALGHLVHHGLRHDRARAVPGRRDRRRDLRRSRGTGATRRSSTAATRCSPRRRAGTSSSTSATRAASGSSPTASRSSRSAGSSTASPTRTR